VSGDLIRRTAIITGGTRGIGRGIALKLGSQGYRLVLGYRKSDETAHETLAICRDQGVEAVLVKGDISLGADARALIDCALARFGSVDVLINNASLNIDKPLTDLTEDDWDTVVDTNMKGVFLCSQNAGRIMLEQDRGGAIINIGATTGIQGRRNGLNYCASKAGVLIMTKCLALELAPKVRVNCVIPGSTADCGPHWRSPEDVRRKELSIPLGRLGTIEEVAEAVSYLISDNAAYITGQKIIVDGGQFMF
jgi:3-oxoacyl-[acyl-carrier protein] reductase